jgi:hypothetical protein
VQKSDAAIPIKDVVKRYIAVWNEPDADARSRAVAEGHAAAVACCYDGGVSS